MNDIQVTQYLKRINFQEKLNKNIDTLNKLHIAHMEHIPFENLDISLNNPIKLSLHLQFKKIIKQNRGGFCYELNYLFFSLLQACGFSVKLLSAQVYSDEGLGEAFDHMLLLIEIEDDAYIADVGFGDSFIQPLLLNSKVEEQRGDSYKVLFQDGFYTLFQQKKDNDWMAQYRFKLVSYDINAFISMCEYQQTSPESSFTKKSVCSLVKSTGRVTISNGRFIETKNRTRRELRIQNPKQYRELLWSEFQMSLPNIISDDVWLRLIP